MKREKTYLDIAKLLLQIEQKAYKNCSKNKIIIKSKGPHDLVTNWDTALEKSINSLLLSEFPKAKIVSEEFNSTAKAKGTYFTVDPIDGTVNFANGLYDLWGIQIAYVENDVTVASALLIPSIGDYFCAKNFGAFKDGEKFSVESKQPKNSLVCIEGQNSKDNAEIQKSISGKILNFRSFGSCCIHATMMAEGKLGALVQHHGHPWDILPGVLLMEEAGCLKKEIGKTIIFASSKETMQIVEKAVLKAQKSTK